MVDPKPKEWPKLMYNVNLPLRIAYNIDQIAEMGSAWRAADLSPFYPEVPGVEIDPDSQNFAAAGGTGTVDVRITSAGQSGTWTVDQDASATWITIVTPQEPQTVDGQVRYNVAPNTSGVQRAGNLYINGKTHTVTQVEVGG